LDRYPAPVSVTALEYVVGAILLALTSITWVKNPSSWAVSQRANLLAIAYAVCASLSFKSYCFFLLLDSSPFHVTIYVLKEKAHLK
jgi:hypothetical protein